MFERPRSYFDLDDPITGETAKAGYSSTLAANKVRP
jgi:hypothetical protein